MGANFFEQLYARSPLWLQNIMVSVKGYEYRHHRANDTLIKKQFLFLRQSEQWSLEEYRDYQAQQLRVLLTLAFQQVPWYRELKRQLGCEPEDFKTIEDIQRLPILDKSQVRGQEHLFLNESINLKKCTHGFTSGTTGTPLNLYETQESFSHRWAFIVRLRSWAGLPNPFLPRRAQFTGRNIVPIHQSPRINVFWRWNRPGNSLLFSTTHIAPETVPYYANALCKFQPELIDGYPSAMLIIARLSRRLGLKLPKPKAIIVTAETHLPEQRQELEDAFQCRVFNQYSSSEPSCFWCDCEEGVMHENPEYGISELVDVNGKPVPEGMPGEVVTTSFQNPVMILIRYRLGDIAVRSRNTNCRCGRSMPIIEEVQGRLDDILFVPERGYVGRLDPVFKGLENIVESQIVQKDLDHIQVLLVPAAGYNEVTEYCLMENLRAKLGQRVRISIEKVDRIPRGPNGKFRSVISEVRHLYPDRM